MWKVDPPSSQKDGTMARQACGRWKKRRWEDGKMRGWGKKAGVGDGEIPEGGSGTRRRPKRTGLWRGYRCGLRPVGAIGPTPRREGGIKKEGEVLKVELGMRNAECGMNKAERIGHGA